jgi:hypothetical protein
MMKMKVLIRVALAFTSKYQRVDATLLRNAMYFWLSVMKFFDEKEFYHGSKFDAF